MLYRLAQGVGHHRLGDARARGAGRAGVQGPKLQFLGFWDPFHLGRHELCPLLFHLGSLLMAASAKGSRRPIVAPEAGVPFATWVHCRAGLA